MSAVGRADGQRRACSAVCGPISIGRDPEPFSQLDRGLKPDQLARADNLENALKLSVHRALGLTQARCRIVGECVVGCYNQEGRTVVLALFRSGKDGVQVRLGGAERSEYR